MVVTTMGPCMLSIQMLINDANASFSCVGSDPSPPPIDLRPTQTNHTFDLAFAAGGGNHEEGRRHGEGNESASERERTLAR
jgi:hypothetical protein